MARLLVGALLLPLLVWLFGEQREYLYFSIVAALFVVVRHRPNIERLLQGQELKIKAGKSGENKAKDKPADKEK